MEKSNVGNIKCTSWEEFVLLLESSDCCWGCVDTAITTASNVARFYIGTTVLFLNFLLMVTSFISTQAFKIILYYSWTICKPCPRDTYILERSLNVLNLEILFLINEILKSPF